MIIETKLYMATTMVIYIKTTLGKTMGLEQELGGMKM